MGVLTPLLDAFKEYVKDKRYAYIAAPLCTLLSVYGTTTVAAYEFVRSEYEYRTSVELFLHSYVFLQITIAFAAAAAVTIIALVRRPDGRRRPLHSRVYDYLQKRRRTLLWKGSAIFVVAAAALL